VKTGSSDQLVRSRFEGGVVPGPVGLEIVHTSGQAQSKLFRGRHRPPVHPGDGTTAAAATTRASEATKRSPAGPRRRARPAGAGGA